MSALATIPLSVDTATGDVVYWNNTAADWAILLTGSGSAGPFLPLTGGTISGNLAVTGTTTLGVATATTPATADNSTHIATTAWVRNQGYATTAALGGYLPLTGGTLTGALTINAGTGTVLTTSGGILVTGGLSTTGPGAGLFFHDQAGGTNPTWVWFANAGSAYLSNPTGGNVWTINAQGGLTLPAMALTQSGTALTLTSGGITAINATLSGGIVGVTNGSNAASGYVGELLTASAATVPLSSGATVVVVSLALAAGDYDVWGHITHNVAAGTTPTQLTASLNNASGFPGLDDPSTTMLLLAFAAGQPQCINTGTKRFNLAAAGTAYLIANPAFTGGAMTADGSIWARRVR